MAAPLHVVEVSVPGGYGQLEGRLLYHDATANGAVGAICCPPHPLLAGNMDNNVVQAVAKAVAETMPVLLFNYPAVGKSTSPHPGLPLFEVWNRLDQGKDYRTIIEEVQRVIAWSGAYFCRCHLIGYSFGACMALAARPSTALSFTAIAPPLAEEDFSALSALSLPLLLITAEQETLCTATDIPLPHARLTHTAIPGADHFFRNQEGVIAGKIVDFLAAHS
jgi:alpha/beta superfamily hydrolase